MYTHVGRPCAYGTGIMLSHTRTGYPIRVWAKIRISGRTASYSLLLICHLLVRNIHYIGKPAKIMYKSDVDWAPCLVLDHQKINLTVLEAAHERAKRYDARRKKIDQSAESIPCSSHKYPSDTNTKETQTETVATPCTSIGIQTELDDFLWNKIF